MVVVMEGVVVGGGPHRDALFVNGILGWTGTHNRKKIRGGEFRRIEVVASERGVSCGSGSSVRSVEHPATAEKSVQEQQEIIREAVR